MFAAVERRTTALVIAGVAVAMLVVGLVVNAIDDGGDAAGPGTSCIDAPPLVVVDVGGGEGGNDLTVVQPDGATSVVAGPGDVLLDADVTPDRTGLVAVVARGDFASAGPDSTTIWALGLDGGNPRPLTEGEVTDEQPVVSPDGTTVAFVRRAGGTTSILTVPVAGGEPTVVVPGGGTAQATAPEWSPDGARIAHVRSPSTLDAGASEVWTVAADGSDAHPVAAVPHALTLDWGPDGSQLLVSTGVTLDPPTVSVLDLTTGAVRPVAEEAARGRWSRGGTQMVFLRHDGDSSYRLVERAVVGVDGADVSGRTERDLGVTVPFLYPNLDIAVAPCVA